MISLYNINNNFTLNYTNIKENEWYNIDKTEKQNPINEIEKTILYRLGINSKKTSIRLYSKLDEILSNNDLLDIDGDKILPKFNIIMSLKNTNSDKYYLYEQDSNKKISNCLIVNTCENSCIGFNSKKILSSHIGDCSTENKYLFIYYTNTVIKGSIDIDSETLYSKRLDNFDVTMIKKNDIQFVNNDENISFFNDFVRSYDSPHKYAYIKFNNQVEQNNNFFLDKDLEFCNDFLNNDSIHKYLTNDNIKIYKSNIALYKYYFDKQFTIINKITNTHLDLYIISLVEQFCTIFNRTRNETDSICITICNTLPVGTVIMVPLIEDNVTISQNPLIFIRDEKHKENEESNTLSINICENTHNNVYFFNSKFNFKLSDTDKCNFCCITLVPAMLDDSQHFLKPQKCKMLSCEEIKLEKVKIEQLIQENMNKTYTYLSYDDTWTALQLKYGDALNDALQINKNVSISDNYFDVVQNDENEKWFDILNDIDVINNDTLEIIKRNKNNKISKKIYLQIAPKISKYFELTKQNVINVELRSFTGKIRLEPPNNSLYIIVFVENGSELVITTNTVLEFNPVSTPGSILIYTYKKEVTITSDKNYSMLVFTVEIT